MKWMLVPCTLALLCSAASQDTAKVINRADMSWRCEDGTEFHKNTINKAAERSAQRWTDSDFDTWGNSYPHEIKIGRLMGWTPTAAREMPCNKLGLVLSYPILPPNTTPAGVHRVLISRARKAEDKNPGPGKEYTYSFCGVAIHFQVTHRDYTYKMCTSEEYLSSDQPSDQVQLS